MSDYLVTVEKLLAKAERFDNMSPGQKAALRANLTKLLQAVDDPDIVAILEAVQAEIGTAEKPAYKPMTADDLVEEYAEKYSSYSMKQRGAFKAKISRLVNKASESGDDETVNKLQDLQDTMTETANRLRKKRILSLGKKWQK